MSLVRSHSKIGSPTGQQGSETHDADNESAVGGAVCRGIYTMRKQVHSTVTIIVKAAHRQSSLPCPESPAPAASCECETDGVSEGVGEGVDDCDAPKDMDGVGEDE